MKQLICLTLLLACLGTAQKSKPDVFSGILTDFTEQRHTEPWVTDSRSMHSCVDWLYTIKSGTRVYVAVQSTCYPNWVKPLKVIVNQSVSFLLKQEKLGLLDTKGKPHWFRIQKVTAEP